MGFDQPQIAHGRFGGFAPAGVGTGDERFGILQFTVGWILLVHGIDHIEDDLDGFGGADGF